MLARIFARITGFRSGRTHTPVPSLIRVVRIASAARVDSASRKGKGRFDPSRI